MLDQAREYATMASNLNQLVAQLKESNAVIAGMAADQANQNAKLRSQQANNRT
jgi:peroxiredoxin